jgi:uncharacterized protein (DUF983 family)
MAELHALWKKFLEKDDKMLAKEKSEKKLFVKKRYCIRCEKLFETYAKEGKVCEKCKVRSGRKK